jgi:hypothetical protein
LISGAATSQNGKVAPKNASPRAAGTHVSVTTPKTSHAIRTGDPESCRLAAHDPRRDRRFGDDVRSPTVV